MGKSKLTFHKLDWLEKIALVLGIWFLVYPRPYEILLGILLVLPIAGILLNGRKKPSICTLIEISKKDKKNKYDVADFIDFPALIIMIRVLLDYQFDSIKSMILPGTLAAIIILSILFLTHKKILKSKKNKWWIYTSIIFNVTLYSFAGTYAANCTYDYSKPSVYESKVLNKKTKRGRKGRRRYLVTVAPWGHHFDKESISITKSQYDELAIGETIKIDLKPGLFGIPWYYIERK